MCCCCCCWSHGIETAIENSDRPPGQYISWVINKSRDAHANGNVYVLSMRWMVLCATDQNGSTEDKKPRFVVMSHRLNWSLTISHRIDPAHWLEENNNNIFLLNGEQNAAVWSESRRSSHKRHSLIFIFSGVTEAPNDTDSSFFVSKCTLLPLRRVYTEPTQFNLEHDAHVKRESVKKKHTQIGAESVVVDAQQQQHSSSLEISYICAFNLASASCCSPLSCSERWLKCIDCMWRSSNAFSPICNFGFIYFEDAWEFCSLNEMRLCWLIRMLRYFIRRETHTES